MSLYDSVGIDGVARPASWDTVLHLDADGEPGSTLEFVADTAGDEHIVAGDGPLAACADTLAPRIERPYVAHAVSIAPGRWLVGARRVSGVVTLPHVTGDEVSVSWIGERREQSVDGAEVTARFEPLEAFHRQGIDCAVVARRMTGELFLVELNLL